MAEHQYTHQPNKTDNTSQKQTILPKQIPTSHPAAIIQRARVNPKSLTHADVMQLQRTIGNRTVGRLLSEIGLIPSTAKPVQRQETPEEEPLQGKMTETVQRQEMPEEEEPLQGKVIKTVQRQEILEEEEPLQGKFEGKPEQVTCSSCSTLTQQKEENHTGMPDNLKAGIENLSGIDMSDVRVHYNSDKPAEVGALAYTQGADIHVAPGQERHLPHEAWHVVQQAQGRVKPTLQLKDGIKVNDDLGLEYESDTMGYRSNSFSENKASNTREAQKNDDNKVSVIETSVFQLYKGYINNNLDQHTVVNYPYIIRSSYPPITGLLNNQLKGNFNVNDKVDFDIIQQNQQNIVTDVQNIDRYYVMPEGQVQGAQHQVIHSILMGVKNATTGQHQGVSFPVFAQEGYLPRQRQSLLGYLPGMPSLIGGGVERLHPQTQIPGQTGQRETRDETIRREMREEVGYQIDPIGINPNPIHQSTHRTERMFFYHALPGNFLPGPNAGQQTSEMERTFELPLNPIANMHSIQDVAQHIVTTAGTQQADTFNSHQPPRYNINNHQDFIVSETVLAIIKLTESLGIIPLNQIAHH